MGFQTWFHTDGIFFLMFKIYPHNVKFMNIFVNSWISCTKDLTTAIALK